MSCLTIITIGDREIFGKDISSEDCSSYDDAFNKAQNWILHGESYNKFAIYCETNKKISYKWTQSMGMSKKAEGYITFIADKINQ